MKTGLLIIDWCLSFWVGRYGFTVGPWFVTLDKDKDIAHQFGVMSNPMSDFNCEVEFTIPFSLRLARADHR